MRPRHAGKLLVIKTEIEDRLVFFRPGVLEDHLEQAGVYSLGSKVNGAGLVLQLSNSCTQTISGARASMFRD